VSQPAEPELISQHFAAAVTDLRTVRDFLRFAVSRFTAAGLVHGHGATTALDEAAYLILETLHLPIDQLDPWLEARLTGPERQAVAAILERRIRTRKPAAYLTGRAWIQGVPFFVDERVIVPRSFIGELLAGELFGGGLPGSGDGFALIEEPEAVERVLDLCTGSGCLAILAAQRFPNARIDAVDLSPEALQVARINVDEHGLADRITLHQGDLFAPLKRQRYDLILTNPPYVDAEAMAELPPEYRAEPALALAGGADGLDIVRRIVKAAPKHLTPAGGLVCELGRCRPQFEDAFPDLDVLWLETAESFGEVFWATKDQLEG
jgi:ribosomal protein L3 glutamine methyltransferase